MLGLAVSLGVLVMLGTTVLLNILPRRGVNDEVLVRLKSSDVEQLGVPPERDADTVPDRSVALMSFVTDDELVCLVGVIRVVRDDVRFAEGVGIDGEGSVDAEGEFVKVASRVNDEVFDNDDEMECVADALRSFEFVRDGDGVLVALRGAVGESDCLDTDDVSLELAKFDIVAFENESLGDGVLVGDPSFEKDFVHDAD